MPPSYPKFYNPDDLLADYVMDELIAYHGGEAISTKDVTVSFSDKSSIVIVIDFKNFGREIYISIPHIIINHRFVNVYDNFEKYKGFLHTKLPSQKMKEFYMNVSYGQSNEPIIEEAAGGSASKTTKYIKTTIKHDKRVVYKHHKTDAFYIKQKTPTGKFVWKKITLKTKN